MQYIKVDEIEKVNELEIRTRTVNELLKAYTKDGSTKQADARYFLTTILPLVTDSLDFVCDSMADISDLLAIKQQEAHE